MTSIWRQRSKKALAVSNELPMPEVVYEILAGRGFNSLEEIQKIISPKLNQLKDPFSMKGMDLAVQRMVRSFQQNEKICIYADFDLDGTSGLALLRKGLLDLGFKNIIHYQPKRLSEGYGFHADVVTEMKAQNVSVIITVDVGITAFAACAKAKELGIDVILTDHHQPGEILPEAFVVINPNQKTCESKLGYLCGAGVAFYFLRAVKRALLDEKLISEERLDLKSVLDCLTIATLTDMVPLIEDNRVLVKSGLKVLEQTQRPGLRALLESLGMSDRPLSGQDVSIRFAPKLNALSRMEMGLLPIDLYLMEDPEEARRAIKKVLLNNQTRVNLQMDGEREALLALQTEGLDNCSALYSPHFHRGVIGLIATKVAQAKNLPAFIGSLSTENRITGSARVADEKTQSVLKALEYCSSVLDRFGGHHAAAGFELHVDKWPQFLILLEEHFEKIKGESFIPEVVYDIHLPVGTINESLMKWFDILGPFGQGFPVPLLRLQHLSIQSWKELSGGHWKLKLRSPDTQTPIEALWFSPPPNIKSQFSGDKVAIELLGEIQWNYFAGRKSVQILIREMRKSHEIEKKQFEENHSEDGGSNSFESQPHG